MQALSDSFCQNLIWPSWPSLFLFIKVSLDCTLESVLDLVRGFEVVFLNHGNKPSFTLVVFFGLSGLLKLLGWSVH